MAVCFLCALTNKVWLTCTMRVERPIGSGYRAGVELQEAVGRVQERAKELSAFLNKEVPSVLDGEVVGLKD